MVERVVFDLPACISSPNVAHVTIVRGIDRQIVVGMNQSSPNADKDIALWLLRKRIRRENGALGERADQQTI
jgi:hypothetical protein